METLKNNKLAIAVAVGAATGIAYFFGFIDISFLGTIFAGSGSAG